MRYFLSTLCFIMAGCNSATEKAEQQYEIVKQSGDAVDVCRKGRELADEYLKVGDADRYRARKVETAIDCQGRTMDEADGIFRMPDGTSKRIEPDNMEAMPDTTH